MAHTLSFSLCMFRCECYKCLRNARRHKSNQTNWQNTCSICCHFQWLNWCHLQNLFHSVFCNKMEGPKNREMNGWENVCVCLCMWKDNDKNQQTWEHVEKENGQSKRCRDYNSLQMNNKRKMRSGKRRNARSQTRIKSTKQMGLNSTAQHSA